MSEREWRFYLDIDNDTLWSIIHDDVPTLLEALVQLRDEVADTH